MSYQRALHAQLLDLPDDDLDELLDQVLEERRGPVAQDEEAICDEPHGSGHPVAEIEEEVRTANQIAADLEALIQEEYGGFTEAALRSLLLAVIDIWLRKYWGHREDGKPVLAVQTLLKTLEPEITLLAEPLVAEARSKIN